MLLAFFKTINNKCVTSLFIAEESDQGESLDRRKCSTGLISLFDQTPAHLAKVLRYEE